MCEGTQEEAQPAPHVWEADAKEEPQQVSAEAGVPAEAPAKEDEALVAEPSTVARAEKTAAARHESAEEKASASDLAHTLRPRVLVSWRCPQPWRVLLAACPR